MCDADPQLGTLGLHGLEERGGILQIMPVEKGCGQQPNLLVDLSGFGLRQHDDFLAGALPDAIPQPAIARKVVISW